MGAPGQREDGEEAVAEGEATSSGRGRATEPGTPRSWERRTQTLPSAWEGASLRELLNTRPPVFSVTVLLKPPSWCRSVSGERT